MPSKKEQLLESDDEGEGAIVNVSDTKKHLTRPGLPPHVALNFLDDLDSYGSPDCVSNQNRLIATVEQVNDIYGIRPISGIPTLVIHNDAGMFFTDEHGNPLQLNKKTVGGHRRDLFI
jgi:hypothetical protein